MHEYSVVSELISVLLPKLERHAGRISAVILVKGELRDDSRIRFAEVIEELVARGAEGVILGCTEIGMLVDSGASSVPLFDSAMIHARQAADLALSTPRAG